jgi:GMP synthase-like glutamine amidotransferase
VSGPPTTVGLLECGHVADRFRAVHGDYADMFGALFAAHLPGVELRPYDVEAGELPPGPDACDAWLCSGSRHSVYDELDWIAPLSAFVRSVAEAKVPFVGICFGHQLVAHALGGRVAKAPTGWGAGVHEVVVDRVAPWMDPPAATVALQFMHQDQVEQLPAGGVSLGRAEHCPVALLQVGPAMVGIQAHPEFSMPYVDALLADRVELIGADRASAAQAGLARPTDEATVARWIGRALTGPVG